MDVHKHPSHVTHKKRWTEYLLEFLMLFLAVYVGFLAENFREGQAEKERARQYIRSFYQDLKTDTARISFYTGFDGAKLAVLENLKNCYDTVSGNPASSACLLDIIKNSSINRPFKITERTLNQLSNAGGFRLLVNEDADSVIAYQKTFYNFQDFQQTVFQQAQDNVRATFNLLVNFKANIQMFKPHGERLVTSFDENNISGPVLYSADKALLNKYFNDLLLYYRVTYNHRGMLLDLRDNEVRLMEYFKKRYGFE